VLRVRRCELVPDSQSAGMQQGGAALLIELENTGFEALITVRGMNRMHFRPWGFQGGRHGRLCEATLNPGRANERNLGKINVLQLAAGDVLRIATSAGGGFGDPLDRPLDKIERDLQSGLMTRVHAERAYGLVFGNDGSIDPNASAARRAQLRHAAPETALFDYGPERVAYDRIWPTKMRSRLAIKVLEQKASLRQNVLILVEQALTRRGHPVNEASLDAALVEALDEVTGRSRRRVPALPAAAQ
jgi:N-methylhydantoinase B